MVHRYRTNKKVEVLLFIFQIILILGCLTNYAIIWTISLNVYQYKFLYHTKKPMIISCLYRQPNGDIETTIDVINKMIINKQ